MREKSLRTYLDFPNAVDPAHILTMADLDLSIALGSSLVTYNDARELVSGLAERWTVSERNVTFKLRTDLKWSDGSQVTAQQYEASLNRAKQKHGDDLRALFDSLESVHATDSNTVEFKLRSDVTAQSLLAKLTEPMYALLAISTNGSVDLSKSTGAYVVEKQDSQSLTLKANPYWYARSGHEPEFVELRRPLSNRKPVEDFATDSWANLVSGNSIQKQATLDNFRNKKFGVWSRKLDKLFALFPTKAFLDRGGDDFIRALSVSPFVPSLMDGLAGYTPANQFFPRGYALWSAEVPVVKPGKVHISGPIRIIIPSSYSQIGLTEKLAQLIEGRSKMPVKIEAIPLQDLNARMKKQDYDLLATGLAVADPNFEGAVSFFIERDPPFIASRDGQLNFAGRVKAARGLKSVEERASAMRSIFSDAQSSGFFLPLFHSSSFAVAKPEIDISQVPDSIETIIFSKVRVK